MDPITRKEMYLSAVAGDTSADALPDPITREEMYLSAAAGDTSADVLPDPITREEFFLKAIVDNGGGSSAVLIDKTITANGEYDAADDDADGYSSVSVEVEGGSTLTTKSVTANGTYNASDDAADGYSSVTVSVPNTYAAGDEGKVVSNGALVSQSSDTATTNNTTIDTTLINSLTINVPIPTGATKLTMEQVSSQEVYIFESDNFVFIFGCFVLSTSRTNFTMTVPNNFDTSVIGEYQNGTVRYSTTNRSISSQSISGNTISITVNNLINADVLSSIIVTYAKASAD